MKKIKLCLLPVLFLFNALALSQFSNQEEILIYGLSDSYTLTPEGRILTDGTQGHLPTLHKNEADNTLSFSFVPRQNNLSYTVQVSTDLHTWQDIPTSIIALNQLHSVSSPLPLNSTPRQFMRLKITVNPVTEINPPGAIVISDVSNNQVLLSWGESDTAGAGYELERATENGEFVKIADLDSGITSYTDQNLSPNTQYRYRLRAILDGIYSFFTDIITTTTLDDPEGLDAPEDFSAVARSWDTIHLSWAPVPEVTYELERKLSTEPDTAFVLIAEPEEEVAEHIDNGLLENTVYTYRLRAKLDDEYSDYSYTDPLDTRTLQRPQPPSNAQGNASASNQVNLTWDASPTADVKYEIERSANGGDYEALATVNGTSYQDTDVLPDTVYSYRIRAKSGENYSIEISTEVVTPLSPPGDFVVTANGSNSMDISWSGQPSGVFYDLERKSGDGEFAMIARIENEHQFHDQMLDPSTSYTYRLRSALGLSISDYTAERSASTTAPVLVKPEGLGVRLAAHDRIALAWNVPIVPGGVFMVERRTAGAGFTPCGSSPVNAFLDRSITPGESYEYRIHQVLGSTVSPFSDSCSATAATAPVQASAYLPAPADVSIDGEFYAPIYRINWLAVSPLPPQTVNAYRVYAGDYFLSEVTASTLQYDLDPALLTRGTYEITVSAVDADNVEGASSIAVSIEIDPIVNIDAVAYNDSYYPQIEMKRIINQYYPPPLRTDPGRKAYWAYDFDSLPWPNPLRPTPLPLNQGNNYPTSFESYTTAISWITTPMMAELSVGHRNAALMINAQGMYRFRIDNMDKRARRYRIRWIEMYCPFPDGVMQDISTPPTNSHLIQRGESIISSTHNSDYAYSREFRVSPPRERGERGQIRLYPHNPAIDIKREVATLINTAGTRDPEDVVSGVTNHRYPVQNAIALPVSGTNTPLPPGGAPLGPLHRLHLNPGTQFNYMEGYTTASSGRLDMESIKLEALEGAGKIRLFVQEVETAQWTELSLDAELKNPYFTDKAALGKYRFYVQVVQTGLCRLRLNVLIGGVNTRADLSIASAEFITPAGDPVYAPVDGGDGSGVVPDGANEFTYSSASPGALTIKLKARMTGAENLSANTKAQLRFEVDGIGDSTMTWDLNNPSGQATTTGDELTASVRFTNLPSRNEHFGKKKARLMLGKLKIQEVEYEVFFPRDAMNHPGSGSGVIPNWFFYWMPLTQQNDIVHGGVSPGGGAAAEVQAMRRWNYITTFNKNMVLIYDLSIERGRPYGVGKEMSGIDMFFGTVTHEKKHVAQITLADSLLISNGADAFRFGWSWNQQLHNHWDKGPDGEWGVAGTDDDGNGITDDATVSPPFEPGHGDDRTLDHPVHVWWPNNWPLPNPLYSGIHPIECEAINEADALHNENDKAHMDWGNPGKNHQTLNQYDN